MNEESEMLREFKREKNLLKIFLNTLDPPAAILSMIQFIIFVGLNVSERRYGQK